ncbi:TATA box-binding protein-associated factor RNA polymerase I subunit C isoform X1 [Xyrichtys novacula]|uniref:TATA box-binding protein-associated factor RNA polymerase I subunit C isoform X1 n=1 Tax=Xyrichtys novacula TaxID=13765 RepID=A0AAV1GDG1_XYRNO|nr:TATA box-binding protein-associated factor RNA polymerase I subunit C isoform X1 [Xyrichtys novacula]
MDYQFPQQLFPSFYNRGPPDLAQQHCAGKWGSYDGVRAQGSPGPGSCWRFTSRHQVKAETWRQTEPAPIPLLSHRDSVLWPLTLDPLDFRDHMENFFKDHCQAAFGCMGEILGENLNFKEKNVRPKEKYQRNWDRMWTYLKKKNYKNYYRSTPLNYYSTLLSDGIHSVPPELLGSLLYEELTEQRNRLLFSEGATGGALAFIPFSQSPQHGCLIYPGNKALDCLNFHQMELQNHTGGPSAGASMGHLSTFHLKGPIRQISSASLLNQSCVAVRSDYLCGVWGFSETDEPHLHQVVKTRKVATCISVSPHVLGEVLVASESGAANLWTVGKGMQKIREEDCNLYFNAKSSWRWCEFSAHPRVMLYADRTGVELTDIRVNPIGSHTLFCIGNTSECRSGERLILSKYLGEVHTFHHLVTTQYSAYIIDERFPGVPMLKWDHMMQSPPLFCHVIPGSASSGLAGGAGTTKFLLGSQSSQEITLLQYSGGRVEACSSHGPPQALLRPRDSTKYLPIQIPHRHETLTNRLSSPAAGLTCIQMTGETGADGKERLCVLQLTETGDIFYQIIQHEQPDSVSASAAEDDSLPEQKVATTETRTPTDSQMVVSETSSDEDVIGPTQNPNMKRFVAETPEKIQRRKRTFFDSSSEESDTGLQKRRKQLNLQVTVNEDPDTDQMNRSDKSATDGELNESTNEQPEGVEETVDSRSLNPVIQTPVELSDSALLTWKRWLKKLMRKSRKKEPLPPLQQNVRCDTWDLTEAFGEKRDPEERECVQNLRRDLKACMSKRTVLVHTLVSNSITAPDVEPLPDMVDTGAWGDSLSQRLTVSTQGEEKWRAWWEDKLGMNRKQKVEALRRKRSRAKAAKRASGRHLGLLGSFTSSVSYQSDFSDFTDSQGWMSSESQGAWSDFESIRSQSEGVSEKESEIPKRTSLSMAETDSPAPATPQSVKAKQNDQQTSTTSRTSTLPQTPSLIATPSSQRKSKHSAQDFLRSLVRK